MFVQFDAVYPVIKICEIYLVTQSYKNAETIQVHYYIQLLSN